MNQEIKGNLARLLATENLIVEHRKVPTASFDVDRRVLTLPNWDRASSVVYDMLVGHEVGHALFTPNEDWRDFADCPKDFVNIVEDARIEKLMKRKYPGLRKSFSGGYKELNDQDFFGISGDDLNTYSLIDRINLHFKVGASALIPFADDEQVFVKRTEDSETFAEVCQIALDVYNFSKKEQEQEQIEANIDNTQTTQGGGSMTQEESNPEMGEDDNGDENENTSGGAPSGDQSTQKQDDDGGAAAGDDPGEEGSKTQDAFDRAAEKFTNMFASNSTYIEIPDSVVVEDYVADWTEIHDWIDEQRELWINCNAHEAYKRDEAHNEVDAAYREFRKSSMKEVNYLVKEFECRKSADAYARSGQSKTGVLDTGKLHTYKFNEDLFKKVTILPDGKNHGLLFLLDWSGSMQREILATVKQLLNLTAFCKKVQIPFEVYAFTNDYDVVRRAKQGKSRYYSDEEYFEFNGCRAGKMYLPKGQFHLMNFISSRSNSKDYERMCLNIFREAYIYSYHAGYPNTLGMNLSGTPLNEGIVMLNYILPEFQKQNDIQKVNVCILTDGDACQSSYGREFYNDYKDQHYVRPRRIEHGSCLRDRKTGRVYTEFDGWEKVTNILIRQLRDRNSSVNVLGFRIMGGGGLVSFVNGYGDCSQYDKVQKQWKKEKSAIVPNPKAFTALYVIANSALEDSTTFSVGDGANKTEITKAFKKMLGSKSTNKKLLNSFVEHVA
jgi:hypothetical protein